MNHLMILLKYIFGFSRSGVGPETHKIQVTPMLLVPEQYFGQQGFKSNIYIYILIMIFFTLLKKYLLTFLAAQGLS